MLATAFSPSALALLLLTALPSPAQALGINCRGSAICSQFFNGAATGHEAKVLADWIQGIEAEGYQPVAINSDRIYKNGEQIACYGRSSICAFLQKTPNGLSGGDIRKIAKYIPEHGCTICGSVPIDFPKTNDVNKGELTFNYVTKNCGNGIC
ncbi:hypothetical protein JX265_001299 [Neoarthrinium moseri]|uniref:Killer toxin Kp4 domain-containing protein n=1 Tax=Neoarthrinium moseri TaxID=1658444 RepID=A0A9P9WXY9_9PEZI|nr:uncharacterized protein JN550_010749 [Neoarthrinium moseri]KAI1848968.1 hypothetical protein JX266_005396 [Neoarthrinium moseri]KAI1861679.1 hypothetical protein JN550_010749 [Neoarthrinium moseri]KAI1881059.1 hypothetical protein JX265_001299 [Neoarthrinium moseri]